MQLCHFVVQSIAGQEKGNTNQPTLSQSSGLKNQRCPACSSADPLTHTSADAITHTQRSLGAITHSSADTTTHASANAIIATFALREYFHVIGASDVAYHWTFYISTSADAVSHTSADITIASFACFLGGQLRRSRSVAL